MPKMHVVSFRDCLGSLTYTQTQYSLCLGVPGSVKLLFGTHFCPQWLHHRVLLARLCTAKHTLFWAAIGRGETCPPPQQNLFILTIKRPKIGVPHPHPFLEFKKWLEPIP